MKKLTTRPCGGYVRRWSEHGKTRVQVKCPFCHGPIVAYLWSLAGSGKKCACGAKLHHDGSVKKRIST